jgi:hypothetical protein
MRLRSWRTWKTRLCPIKYIEKMVANYERIFGQKPKNAASPLVKVITQNLTVRTCSITKIPRSTSHWLVPLQWVVQLGRIDIIQQWWQCQGSVQHPDKDIWIVWTHSRIHQQDEACDCPDMYWRTRPQTSRSQVRLGEHMLGEPRKKYLTMHPTSWQTSSVHSVRGCQLVPWSVEVGHRNHTLCQPDHYWLLQSCSLPLRLLPSVQNTLQPGQLGTDPRYPFHLPLPSVPIEHATVMLGDNESVVNTAPCPIRSWTNVTTAFLS